MTQPPKVATVYLQVAADYGRQWSTAEGDWVDTVRSIRVVGYTQKRPTKPKPGTVVIKLELAIPGRAFLPLQPSVVVDVPESLLSYNQIEVEAVDPNDRPEGDL
jgi:hypothetical protein